MFNFVKEHIFYRFGIPHTITVHQGTIFTLGKFEEYSTGMGIRLINSLPCYAQANGQSAKASNKGVIKLIKRKIEECPRHCYLALNEALWAYRMACHGATKVSPYELVYGHEVVLPWEIGSRSRCVM